MRFLTSSPWDLSLGSAVPLVLIKNNLTNGRQTKGLYVFLKNQLLIAVWVCFRSNWANRILCFSACFFPQSFILFPFLLNCIYLSPMPCLPSVHTLLTMRWFVILAQDTKYYILLKAFRVLYNESLAESSSPQICIRQSIIYWCCPHSSWTAVSNLCSLQ